jgi:predicted phage tail protein
MAHNIDVVAGTARIVLHGRLRKKFGVEFRLGVSTPAAATYALCKMVPGFEDELRKGQYHVRRGTLGNGVDLPAHGLSLRLPPSGELHLIPCAKGSKGGGGKIIVGVLLVAASIVLMQPEVAGYLGLSAAAGTTAGTAAAYGFGTALFGGVTIGSVALAGGAMILGGILQAISPQPRQNGTISSFLLGGLSNTSQQGTPVPIVYGRMRVGSIVASIGYSAEDFHPPEYIDPNNPYQGFPPPGETFPVPPVGGTTLAGGTTQMAGSTGLIAPIAGTQATAVFGTGSGGGGKGGGSGGFVQPDTLHSNAVVRIIDVLGEGPIGGLVDGAKSIFFNGTPLQAASGAYNFRGVSWEVRYGYPDQDPVSGFPASEDSVPVQRQVKQANPVVQTITGSSATAARVTMLMPALLSINHYNGDVNALDELAYDIEVRASGPGFVGDYQLVEHIILAKAKASSSYEKSTRFDLPRAGDGADTWDIRVTRITGDSTDVVNIQSDTIFERLDVIDDHKLSYPNTAYIAYTFDASLFGSSLPTRQVEIYGRTVAVPANYDPVTGGYSSSGTGTFGGTWDLTSTIQRPVSNPAWQILDLLSNSRYGCGIPDTYLQTTKADLYQIGQYCDGVVPDGFGGTERRYAVNCIVASQDDAYRQLQLFCAAFRGQTYWGNGQVMVVADMPRTPSKLINQTNVLDGTFDYQSTSLKTRHNLVNVQYLDSSNQFLPAVEPVSDPFDIAKRGVVSTDLMAFGCITRSLAHRLGKWALYTETRQTETATWKGGAYHIDARPGDVVKVSDPAYIGVRMAGRLRPSGSLSVAWLDALLVISDGSTSQSLSVVMPDGTVDDLIPITGFATSGDGTYTIVTLGRDMAQTPLPNAEWIMTDNVVSPREFSILGIAETDKAQLTVTAVNYEAGKFDFIEDNIAFDVPNYSLLPALLTAPLPAPTNVAAIDNMTGVGVSQTIRVTVSWSAPVDPRIASFQVVASSDNFYQIYSVPWAVTFIIDNLPAGDEYTFGVRSVGAGGLTSEWALITAPITVDGKVDPPAAPTGLTAVGATRSVQVSWLADTTRRDIIQYEIWRNSTSAGPGSGAALLSVAGGLSYVDNEHSVLLPDTTWYYWVRAIALGAPLVLGTFAGPASATTTLLLTDDLADAIVNTAKFAQSVAPVAIVATLNVITDLDGNPVPIGGNVVSETDSKLYRRVATGTGVFGANHDYNAVVSAVDLTGQLTDAQIAALAATKITGQLTDAQIAALAATKITGQITTTQISDGGITTPKIATAAVTAGTLAAGAVTTEKLSVGSASNVVWNACLEQSAAGWNIAASVAMAGFGTVKGTAYDPDYRIAGYGSGYIQAAANLATDSSQFLLAYWDPNAADTGSLIGVPFPASTPIEAQAHLLTHRCCARVQIDFYTAAGTFISSITGNRVTVPGAFGNDLANYALSWVHGISPANCGRVRLLAAGFNDGGSDIAAQTTPPYLFFTQTAIGASVANATQPQAWVPGGVTTISGSMVKTGTLDASAIVADSITSSQIAAGAITATELSAGSVTAGKLAANAVTAGTIAANAVTAGTISAGAVSATEIAAGSIHTNLLASDFQLTNSAQIGSLVVDTANIAHLAVGTINIASQAVTNLYASVATLATTVSMTIATDGSPILLWFTAITASNWTTQSATLLLNGSLFYSVAVVGDGASQVGVPTGFYVLNLDPGSYTLALSNNGPIDFAFAMLGALVVKR